MSRVSLHGSFNCKNLNKLIDVFCVCLEEIKDRKRGKKRREREIKIYISDKFK